MTLIALLVELVLRRLAARVVVRLGAVVSEWTMSAPTDRRYAAASPPIRDRARLIRLFVFIREHEDQARAAGDEVRAMQWERLLNRLCDLLPR